MIEVTHLTKKYGDHLAVNDVSFKIEKGEIVGFLGPNGAGKSTTMNIITGYLSSTQGKVTIAGNDILENPIEAKKQIGYLPEIPPLYTEMTVKEYLSFVYDLKKVKLPKAPHLKEVAELVGLASGYTRLIKNLSKGFKQRVGIAQALVGNPEILILDEPTVGLDPKQIIEIRSLIKRLGQTHTIILSSHILSEIQAVCKRIIVINSGNLVADGTPTGLARELAANNRLVIRTVGKETELLRVLRTVQKADRVLPLGSKEDGTYDFAIEIADDSDIRRDVFNALAQNNMPLIGMKGSDMSLEEIFLQLTDASKPRSVILTEKPTVTKRVKKSELEKINSKQKNEEDGE